MKTVYTDAIRVQKALAKPADIFTANPPAPSLLQIIFCSRGCFMRKRWRATTSENYPPNHLECRPDDITNC